MEAILNNLSSNPIFIIVFVFLLILLLISIIKRLIKLLIPVLILIALYFGYLYFTGQGIPKTREELLQHGKEKVEKIIK